MTDDKGQKTKDKKPPSPVSQGISFGVKLWLFYMFAFAFLGYPRLLSILLGVIGGVAGGLSYAWWHITEIPQQQPAKDQQKTLENVTQRRLSKMENQDFKKM